MEEERYCPDCWRMLPADARYCPVCGALARVVAIEPPKKSPRFWSVGPYLAIGAGFVSLLGAFLSFGTLLGFFQFYAFGLDPHSSPGMPVMFMLMAFLGLVGFACGRAAGVSQWSKEGMRMIAVEVGFLSFVGLLHLVVGLMISSDASWLGYFMIIGVGFPILTLTWVSLIAMILY